jgi:hypothetical protein
LEIEAFVNIVGDSEKAIILGEAFCYCSLELDYLPKLQVCGLSRALSSIHFVLSEQDWNLLRGARERDHLRRFHHARIRIERPFLRGEWVY